MAYVVFCSLLALFTIVADLSRVRLVVEDRYSALAAWTAGWRFVRRRPLRLAWLFVLNVLGQAVILRLWIQVAPGAESTTVLAAALPLLYLALRVAARVALVASETVFFQGDLAHATYTAAPPVLWPDSASVEAIRNLRRAAKSEPRAGVR
jgi:hypothetical protein